MIHLASLIGHATKHVMHIIWAILKSLLLMVQAHGGANFNLTLFRDRITLMLYEHLNT